MACGAWECACVHKHDTVRRLSLSVCLHQPPSRFVHVRVYVYGVYLLQLQCSQGKVSTH